jgi:hypothetical protein
MRNPYKMLHPDRKDPWREGILTLWDRKNLERLAGQGSVTREALAFDGSKKLLPW